MQGLLELADGVLGLQLAGQDLRMPVAPKTAATTAPNAAECQSFLDNLVAGLPTIRASDYWVGTSAFGGA